MGGGSEYTYLPAPKRDIFFIMLVKNQPAFYLGESYYSYLSKLLAIQTSFKKKKKSLGKNYSEKCRNILENILSVPTFNVHQNQLKVFKTQIARTNPQCF